MGAMIKAILNLHVAKYIPSSNYGPVWQVVPKISFEEFKESKKGHWNRMVLAILNLHVNPMPPIKVASIQHI